MKNLILSIFFSSFVFANLNIHDFKANFAQTVTNPKGKELKYTGTISFKKEGLKWIYKTPTDREICSLSGMIMIVDHDLEQVTYFKTPKSFNMLEIINKATKYKDNVYTTKKQDILYTIQLHKGKLKYITFIDELENKVLINFKNLKETGLDEIVCSYPKEYDFIRD